VVNVSKEEKRFAEECIELTGRLSTILNSYIDKSKILDESEKMGVVVTVLADLLANTFTFNKTEKKDVIEFFESRYDHNINYNSDIKEEIGEA
jgi:hypothetical protein|tara:strand:- start:535 stop:813 length:279 start_codon:yes stop_codon:yes gene_type:complete